MQVSFNILVSLLLVCIVGAEKRRCGSNIAPAYLKGEGLRSDRISSLRSNKTDTRTLTIKTYFHNIYINRTNAGGYISSARLNTQLQRLNEDFTPSGIQFDLRRITHTKNPKWATHTEDDFDTEFEMKKALRKGDYGDLNLYFRLIPEKLGFCYYPDIIYDPIDVIFDGCDIDKSTIPGGEYPYNEGKTATHEIGHWFGLIHTFEGGCAGGDEVDDTPAEATETYGCPVTKDSCVGPQYPGQDPFHNYMDYSDDRCLNQFTPGQITRMYEMWNTYRATQRD